MRRRRATVATPGECQYKTGGVRRLAVANGPNIFQMLLVPHANTLYLTQLIVYPPRLYESETILSCQCFITHVGTKHSGVASQVSLQRGRGTKFGLLENSSLQNDT